SLAPLSYFFCANAPPPDNNAAADTPPTKVRLLVFTDFTSHWKKARDFPPKRRPAPPAQKKGRHSAFCPLVRIRGSGALAVQDVAEQLPVLALEARQLRRLDRIVVGRAGVDRDARQQQRRLELLVVGRLFHDVLTGQVVAALLKRLVH